MNQNPGTYAQLPENNASNNSPSIANPSLNNPGEIRYPLPPSYANSQNAQAIPAYAQPPSGPAPQVGQGTVPVQQAPPVYGVPVQQNVEAQPYGQVVNNPERQIYQQQNSRYPPESYQGRGVGLNQQQLFWSSGMGNCFDNCDYCLYVWCCLWCAIADLRVASKGEKVWWSTFMQFFGAIVVLYLIGMVFPRVDGICDLLRHIVTAYWVYSTAQMVARKLNIVPEDNCLGCMKAFCCGWCYTCQVGRELEYSDEPTRREMASLINQDGCQCGNPAKKTVPPVLNNVQVPYQQGAAQAV